MSQSGSESDIWEYRPLKKSKRQDGSNYGDHAAKKKSKQSVKKNRVSRKTFGAESNTVTKSSSRNQLPNKSDHGVSVNGSKNNSSAPNSTQSNDINNAASIGADGESGKDSRTEGHCPVCQMPFSILLVQSQRWHVAECLETPGESDKGPTAGSHLELKFVKKDVTTNSSKESSVDSAVNLSSGSSQGASPAYGSTEPHTPTRRNALLLLRSPAPKDIKKKKGWSPSAKESRPQTSSQGAKIWISTPVKAGNNCHAFQMDERVQTEPSDLNEDNYISYSPLSELPAEIDLPQTKKTLFQSTVVGVDEEDDNDSLMLFDDTVIDDDLLSNVLDQYETEESRSQDDPVLVESPNTWDQLESLEPPKHFKSSNSAGAATGPSQPSFPVGFSKEEHLVKNCENISGKSQLQSPGSLVLEHLRECLSNSIDFNLSGSNSSEIKSVSVKQELSTSQENMPATKKQSLHVTSTSKTTIKAPGLKQTDIGVFFGLKPLSKKTESEAIVVKEERLQVASTLAKSLAPAKKMAKQQARHSRKSTAVTEVSTTETAEQGAAQPTQREGGRAVRVGGWKRWNRGRATDGGPEEPKRCPFYKKIPGTHFAVDAFQYGTIEGITAYFLTHFHSDHYGGLTKNSTLPIYCNKITGNLVKSKLKVDEQYVHILPMNTEYMVDGVKVVLLDANHCPGSAMLLFLLPDGQTVLHTGDFRADPSMERYPELQGFRIQTLYLDTTYCSPEYAFPTQQEVITFAANTAFELVTLNPRTLVVCGTYAVGKEKVFLAVSQVLGSKVYMSRDRYNTMSCLESKHIQKCITTNQKSAQVHVLPMMQLNFKNLKTHLSKFSETYDHLVAFKPTGWTFSQSVGVENIQPKVQDNISIYGIPYSEHSSYLELKRFVQWLQPLKIIPTVNAGSWNSRKAMEQCFRDWQKEVKAINTVPRNSCSSSYTRQ
ncbi:DNA cross-link repair 1A protein isoform X2 [Hoplias malabaricus]|uniref:DNA cross-link repair 1A protein isoform X2 n=1 Tax=Hoplias malabaricus TaxID=27720 RepID=UPI0034633CB7